MMYVAINCVLGFSCADILDVPIDIYIKLTTTIVNAVQINNSHFVTI